MTELREIPFEQMTASPYRKGRAMPYPSAERITDAMKHGITENVIVRVRSNPMATERYEILRGVDVWMLAQLARIETVPAIVIKAGDEEARSLVSIDSGADPITTAEAMEALMEEYRYDITSLAAELRMARTTVSNHLRLLKLDTAVQESVRSGDLSMRHAKLLLRVPRLKQMEVATRVIKHGMSSRQMEAIIGVRDERKAEKATPIMPTSTDKDPNTMRLERRLGDLLGNAVMIEYGQGGSGRLTISFHSFEGLEGILEQVGYSEE